MELIRAVAIAIAEDKDLNGKWPEAVEGYDQPASLTQVSSYEVEFDEPYGTWEASHGVQTYSSYEVDNMPYIEEYGTGDTVTKEEFEAYMAANPNLLEDIKNLKPINTAKIAALNTQIAAMIDEMTVLADEIGIAVHVDLGQRGILDLNGDWDSSSC